MVGDYIVVVTEKDQERFRRFCTGYDRNIIKSIDGFSSIENIWALGSTTDPDLWSAIQKNNRIFFAEYGASFYHCGIVYSKMTDQKQAIKIWGDTPRMRDHNRLILFSSVHDIDVSFHKLCRQGGITPSNMSTNIYALKNDISKTIPDIPGNNITGIVLVSNDGPSNKKTEVVTRFIRDTKKVLQLKSIYHNKCQICGRVIHISNNSLYSEVHHLHPLRDDGDDDFDNMLVLCPIHHVEFDYKVIGIDRDQKTVIDNSGKKIGAVTMNPKHKLNGKNIEFHLMEMDRD